MNVRNEFKGRLKIGGMLLGVLLPSMAHANLSSGTFNAIGNMSISLQAIKFTNQPIFSVGTLDFSSPSFGGTTGAIKTINTPPYSINAVFATPNFLTFAALPGVSFTLTQVQGGGFGTAGCATGGPCTPANSPFNLFNQGGSALASFSVSGFETDGVSATPFSGVFSETFSHTNYQTIVTALNAGKTVNTTYTASFEVTPTPEPAFFLPLAAGLLAVAVRKRAVRNRQGGLAG